MRSPFRFFIFSLCFFLSAPSICQYNKTDETLVKTTFTRAFDKKILSSYLNSKDERKIVAALLSISHSEDSSFIPQIYTLEFLKYYETICFTLGQLGEHLSSTQYLWQMEEKYQNSEAQRLIFEAIGKTGNKSDLQKVLALVNGNKIFSQSGFALAVYNFSLRKITETETLSSLHKILTQSEEGIEETLFTLYRTGATDSLSLSAVEKIVRTEIKKETPSQFIIQNALGIFRKAKFFPNDIELLYRLSVSSDPIIRIETARTGIYFPFAALTNFDFLFQLLFDKNPNVARQLALSFRDMQLNETLEANVLQFIRTHLKDKNLTVMTRGELFITFIKRLQTLDPTMIKEYEPFVDKSFIYQACGELSFMPEDIYDYLFEQYSVEKKEHKLIILSSLLKHQEDYSGKKSFRDFVFTVLAEKDISLSTSLLDELSEDFVMKNKNKIVEIILADADRNKNNVNFAGSLDSYYKVIEKADKRSALIFCNILASSSVYSINKFAAAKLGKRTPVQNNGKYFTALWNEAFKYQAANVKTTKGNFVIQFQPEAAPISVGNFCLLAEKNFFNGLKFHRVVPAFVIQGGDPENTGWGGSDIPIVSEFSPYQFQKGIAGMASSGKDTESSQWFVMQAFHPHLNGRYTVFGNVIEGLETALQIDQNDKILSVELLH